MSDSIPLAEHERILRALEISHEEEIIRLEDKYCQLFEELIRGLTPRARDKVEVAIRARAKNLIKPTEFEIVKQAKVIPPEVICPHGRISKDVCPLCEEKEIALPALTPPPKPPL